MIPVTKDTRARLRWMCYKDQTYDQIINLLIDFSIEMSNDKGFREWVRDKLDEEIRYRKEFEEVK